MTSSASSSSSLATTVIPVYRTLVGVGMLCALLIVSVFLATAPVIEQNRSDALQRAIFDVLPGTTTTQTYVYSDQQGLTLISAEQQGATVNGERFYAGFDDKNTLVGVAIQTHGQGYQDVIRILYGYNPKAQHVIGMQVLESRETPGLGDKIEKDPMFLRNFEQLDVSLSPQTGALANAVEAVKSGEKNAPWQVDGITGATISSVAIAQMLDASIRQWAPRIQQLLNQGKLAETTDKSAVGGSHGR